MNFKKSIALLLCALCLAVTAFAAEGDYLKIDKQAFADKTKAGFLSQIAGMLSGLEFKTENGKYAVAMPDDYFYFCDGPYAGNASIMKHTDKHLKGENGIFEIWVDDDFSVDIFNQYILEDSLARYGFVSSEAVSGGWLKYSIHDMGGGERTVGAYGLIERRALLPQFAGNGEFGNMYSYLSEPYLGADTLGMNAAGMPCTARDLAKTFASVTGERDNLEFAEFFAVLISSAYFEDDIPTLIDGASKVFKSGSHEKDIIDEAFALYRKYPSDWRKAFVEFEKNHYTEGITTGANTSVNCGFAVLTLLYGGGDYMTTAKIGSLAGYDCESTCGIALTVLSVIGGSKVLPADVDALIWQDGKGVVINDSPEGIPGGQQMHADNLPRVMPIAEIVEKYVQNFEKILVLNGGKIDGDFYLIPRQTLSAKGSVEIENCGFEQGFENFITGGKCVLTKATPYGEFAAKLSGDGEIYTKVSGLTVGKTYELCAYAEASAPSVLYIFARGKNGVCTSVCGGANAANDAYHTVKRTLVFTADSEEIEIGFEFVKSDDAPLQFAVIDSISLTEADEISCGNAIVEARSSGKMFYAVLQANERDEEYLKLTFKNKNAATVDGKIIINGKGYGVCVFSKTAAHKVYSEINTVYIPVALEKGANTVSISFGGYEIEIVDAKLVKK